MSEEGKEWFCGSTKSPSCGRTSAELDAAMGASENHWWMRPGGECGRHGDGELFLMFVCGSVCAVCVGVYVEMTVRARDDDDGNDNGHI